jgi:hypothetical protein
MMRSFLVDVYESEVVVFVGANPGAEAVKAGFKDAEGFQSTDTTEVYGAVIPSHTARPKAGRRTCTRFVVLFQAPVSVNTIFHEAHHIVQYLQEAHSLEGVETTAYLAGYVGEQLYGICKPKLA